MKLFNTETREKEDIIPSDGNTLRMYTCGPTVYNYAHIGNFRTYVFEDLLRRSLKFFGFKVIQAMNITDVEDKTIRGALAEKVSLKVFTQKYTEAFFEDLKQLGIEPVEYYPLATDYIGKMIEIIEKLLEEGIAYKGTDGSIYYNIEKFPSYGRLSHLDLCGLKAGASCRTGADEYDKEHVSDFALWKIYDPERDGDIFWASPFGKGRPGWHIECSAMAMQLLGTTIDIHVGGVDNMFPHHENEIAQSEAFSKQRFVRYWLHVEHLLVDHRKMSKSSGNFYTLRDLLAKGFTGSQVRYMLLQVHYRMQMNFTFEGLQAAAKSLQRIEDFILRLKSLQTMGSSQAVESILKKTDQAFKEALTDDLNISQAFGALFEMIREINTLCDQDAVSKEGSEKVLYLLQQMDQVLGFLPLNKQEEIPSDLLLLLTQREEARVSKNWKEADACRDLLLSKGFSIEDTPSGARLKKNK